MALCKRMGEQSVDKAPAILAGLQAALIFEFRDLEFLELALVHSSYTNEHADLFPESNERLEFLGDAVLDSVIAAELYHRFPSMSEGELTTAKSALVRGDTLAQMAQELDLGRLLLLGQGEERHGGRGRVSNLAGALEAVLGGAFLDQGYDATCRMILRLFSPLLNRLTQGGVPTNPKSRLQEMVQRQGQASPSYRIVLETGPDHAKHFVAEALVDGQPMGRGSGQRKGEAETAAAQDALARLEASAQEAGVGALDGAGAAQ